MCCGCGFGLEEERRTEVGLGVMECRQNIALMTMKETETEDAHVSMLNSAVSVWGPQKRDLAGYFPALLIINYACICFTTYSKLKLFNWRKWIKIKENYIKENKNKR